MPHSLTASHNNSPAPLPLAFPILFHTRNSRFRPRDHFQQTSHKCKQNPPILIICLLLLDTFQSSSSKSCLLRAPRCPRSHSASRGAPRLAKLPKHPPKEGPQVLSNRSSRSPPLFPQPPTSQSRTSISEVLLRLTHPVHLPSSLLLQIISAKLRPGESSSPRGPDQLGRLERRPKISHLPKPHLLTAATFTPPLSTAVTVSQAFPHHQFLLHCFICSLAIFSLLEANHSSAPPPTLPRPRKCPHRSETPALPETTAPTLAVSPRFQFYRF